MLLETLRLLVGSTVSGLVTCLVMALVPMIGAPWIIKRSVSYPRAYLAALTTELCALSSLILLSFLLGSPQPPVSNMLHSWIGQAAAYWLFGWWACARLLKSTMGELPGIGQAAGMSSVMTAAFLAKNLVLFWFLLHWLSPEMP